MRDESSPVSGSGDSSIRRLGEQVRSLLQGDEFLSRLNLDKIIRVATGGIAALAWGSMNRVELAGNAILRLPPIEPAWIGKPLYMGRQVPTGTATVRGSGSPVPRVNGSPTGIAVTGVGLHVFVTDGADWFAV
jgi:hypothetical protein